MITDQYVNDLLDALLRGEDITFPGESDIYVSLHDDEPDVSGENYNEIDVDREMVTLTEAVDREVENAEQLEFADMPDTTVTHVALWTSETEGDLIWYGELAESREVGQGDIFQFPAGDITATLTSQD